MSRKANRGGKKRGFRWWYILIALLVIGALARPKNDEPDETTPNNSAVSATMEPSPTSEPTATPTPDPTEEPTPVEYTEPPAETEPPAQEQTQTIVYVTNTGTKYHRAGCRHLNDSQIEMTLEEAKKNYEPCGTCNPPT